MPNLNRVYCKILLKNGREDYMEMQNVMGRKTEYLWFINLMQFKLLQAVCVCVCACVCVCGECVTYLTDWSSQNM